MLDGVVGIEAGFPIQKDSAFLKLASTTNTLVLELPGNVVTVRRRLGKLLHDHNTAGDQTRFFSGWNMSVRTLVPNFWHGGFCLDVTVSVRGESKEKEHVATVGAQPVQRSPAGVFARLDIKPF
ncbi:hypothetical protein Bbelb_431180 [Branchiostoma belcheri]|nr:hypothetical protein Bbelb_431180 [Branchiostoma belcheri]